MTILTETQLIQLLKSEMTPEQISRVQKMVTKITTPTLESPMLKPGDRISLAHRMSRKPDYWYFISSGGQFVVIEVGSTVITVQNVGARAASVRMFCGAWHSLIA